MNQIKILALFLLALQVASTALTWTINPLRTRNQAVFGMLLSIDLIAFAIISYTYRADKRREELNWGIMLAGSIGLTLLLLLSVFLSMIGSH